jgi:hypothetical protein
MRVEQFHVKNQFQVYDNAGNVWFQSYDSMIVRRGPDGAITLDVNQWDASKTTGKYRNLFLGEKKRETEGKIKDGTYMLADLNARGVRP